MKNLVTYLILLLVVGATAQTIQEATIIVPQCNKFEVTWDVTPSADNMDGVVALSGVNATTWGELNVIVRCKPEGQFDARNGGDYAADLVLDYEGGKTYKVRVVVDIFMQKYSVFITPPDGAETALATDYAFRVPADILMYKCIFVSEDAVAGATLSVENFNFTVPIDKIPCPIGIEEIRYDAQCDTAWEYEEMGLFDTCPILHEYTAYQGDIVVDGDPGDADWGTIPWTPFNVRYNTKEAGERTYMPNEEFDDLWDSWMDYSGWFKLLWNEEKGVMYYLFKEYDDVIMWPGAVYTDVYDPDVQNVKQWQGDTYEIELSPMHEEQVRMEHIGNVFVIDGEVRYKPLSLASPPDPLELDEGNGETSWDDTDGKAIFYVRDEDAGTSLFELAILLKDGMEPDLPWFFGVAKTEGDQGYADGQNRENGFYWGAGKRAEPQWGSLLFSPEKAPQVGVEDKRLTTLPKEFQLGANYPNPFNPSTTIPFSLNKTEQVKISIYNTVGQKIITLINENRAAGQYQVNWNGTNEFGEKVVSGVYFIQMTTENSTFAQKVLFVQ